MTMTLTESIDAYLTLKRSLGAVFSADTRVLRSFGRAFGEHSSRRYRSAGDPCLLSRQRTADAMV